MEDRTIKIYAGVGIHQQLDEVIRASLRDNLNNYWNVSILPYENDPCYLFYKEPVAITNPGIGYQELKIGAIIDSLNYVTTNITTSYI